MRGETTLRTPGEGGPVVAERVPWLTVLWHPQLARIGDGAPVGERTKVSRLEPELAAPGAMSSNDAPGTAKGEPLGEPHVSRTPITIAMRADGSAVIEAVAAADLVVDGARVAGMTSVSAADIDAGVVLELGGWVALLLHRRRPPVSGKAGTTATPGSAIVGASETIDELRAAIARLAVVDDPVLIAGETGAGKERVARELHARSPRASGPFVAVNMATLAPGTAAAQLFGHVRGAFTGADRAVAGLFAQADGGTLLLDEVFDTPADVQPMLLRVLDTGEILPLGADAPRRVNVRVLAATDANLDAAAARGAFRPQLFHRLAVHRLVAPPLRARVDDIGRLLAAFVLRELGAAETTARAAAATPWLPTAALRACARYAWPGNVRELDAVARRLAVLGRGASIPSSAALAAIGPDAARPLVSLADDTVDTFDGLDDESTELGERVAPTADASKPAADFDDETLVRTLAAQRWQPAAAARALGISKTTLYARMDACPTIRKARDLGRDEIASTQAAAGGDLDQMAETLRVSRRGLQLRMRELGMR